MTKRTILAMLFGITVFGGLGDSAFAEDSDVKSSGKMHGYHKTADEFTDEQLERIYKLKVDYANKNEMSAAELRLLHHQLIAALSQVDLDKSLIASLDSRINAIKAKESDSHVQMTMDIHEVLSPEQKQQRWHRFLEHEVPSAEEIMLGFDPVCDELMPPPLFGAPPPPFGAPPPVCGAPPPPFGAPPPPFGAPPPPSDD